MTSLVDDTREKAQERGPQTAFVFLEDGEREAERLTFAELDRRARAVAARLQTAGAQGERALLIYAPGLEFVAAFYGCLYAGAVAVPVYPPNPAQLDRTMPRLRAIARDADARFVLASSETLSFAAAFAEVEPVLARLIWISTDDVPAGSAEEWRDPRLGGDAVAFLQYTSGSTAAPKGVMVTHENLFVDLAMVERARPLGTEAVGVSWLPLYHDMGLIGHVVYPVHRGFTQYLMSPLAFLQRPLRWLEAISRYRGTVSGAPNFGYQLLVARSRPEQRAALDLRSWRTAYCGAEPLRPDTVRGFAEAFAPAGFRPDSFCPCYGLAEATVLACALEHGHPIVTLAISADDLERGIATPDPAGRVHVGVGEAMAAEIAIVDPERRARLQDGRVGEIWVRGPHVAQGYFRDAARTEEVFQARTVDGEGPFLRTGDLGFIHGGQLFVAGRIKDLIIVAGRNYHPQDLELTAERAHPAVRAGGAAAFGVSVDGEETVALLVEHDGSAAAAEVVAAIRQAVAAEHELTVQRVRLVAPRTLPKTASGKIRRHACRDLFLADGDDRAR
jgi:acyl-CoA synthetase (AMP-forming)/AMP-acid ligase II